MAQRLVEAYPEGRPVEITFNGGDSWFPAIVWRHQHPGLWVITPDGRPWFVTNSRRIRRMSPPE